METKLFMGCDIAQDTFAFCLRDQSKVVCQGEVSNSKKAIQAWLKELKQIYHVDLSSVIFCLEHTGIYGMILMRTPVSYTHLDVYKRQQYSMHPLK